MLSGIAILGAGIFAKEAHLPSLAALGDAAPPLRAVYSRSEKSARDFAAAAAKTLTTTEIPAVYHDGDKSNDLNALLARADISSVIIVLPITTQPSVILQALEAGKHVLSEKPIAADVQKGLELIKIYNEKYKPKGLVWRIAENYEAEPGVRAAGEAIAAGKIGRVQFFRTVVYNYIDQTSKYYNTAWRTIPEYQGGFLLDGGVHTVAALRVLLPKKLTHISSFASLNKEYLAPHDTINVIARSASDLHGTLELTFASPTQAKPVADQFLVTGTNGWLTLNIVGGIIHVKILHRNEAGEEKEESSEHELVGVESEISQFLQVIMGEGEGEGSGLGDPLGALYDVAFIQAALNSDGKLIDLTQLVPNLA